MGILSDTFNNNLPSNGYHIMVSPIINTPLGKTVLDHFMAFDNQDRDGLPYLTPLGVLLNPDEMAYEDDIQDLPFVEGVNVAYADVYSIKPNSEAELLAYLTTRYPEVMKLLQTEYSPQDMLHKYLTGTTKSRVVSFMEGVANEYSFVTFYSLIRSHDHLFDAYGYYERDFLDPLLDFVEQYLNTWELTVVGNEIVIVGRVQES